MSERKRSLRFGVSGALLGAALCAVPACSGGKGAEVQPRVEEPSPAPDAAPDVTPDVAPDGDVEPAPTKPLNVNPGPYEPDEAR